MFFIKTPVFHRLFVALLLFGVSAANADYNGQLKKGDRLIVTSHKPDALLVIGRDGAIQWRSDLKLKHPQQVSTLPDGRVACATIDGAYMLKADGSVQWRYQVPEGTENAVALYLGRGRTLVAHEGRGELLVLNADGKATGVTTVESASRKVHGQFRYVGYGSGHYLVPMLSDSTFREVEPGSGKVLWEIKKLKMVTSAHRLSDGGTFIGYRNTLSRYNASRELEWKVRLKEDLGLLQAVPPTGSLVLPSGNIIVSLWHSVDGVPDIIEFNPEPASIVHDWDVAGISRLGCVALLPEGNPFAKPD